MDKVKKFLESYVEWLALAIGLAFLGWTAYAYVYDKPVTSSVDGIAVEPADIPGKIWEGPGQTLLPQINNPTPPPPMDPVIDYPTQIVGSLSAVPSSVVAVLPAPYTPIPPLIDSELAPAPGPSSGHETKLAVLPSAPLLVNLMSSQGHSNIQPPNPNGAAGGAPAGLVVAIDKNWVTFGANIPVAALAKNFTDARIPVPFSNCAIYRVIVVRQEKDAAGSWGNDTQIEPLDINPLMPLPPINCNFQARQDYKTFAETQANVVLIAEPPFYTILQGDIWYEPGVKNPNEKDTQVVVDPFDPSNPLAFKGDPNTLLPDEKKIYDDAKAKKDAADARRNRNNNGGGSPPSGFTPPGGGFNPQGGQPGGTGGTGRGGGGRGGGGRNAVPEPEPQNPGNLLQPPRGRGGSPPAGFNPYNPGFRPPGMDGGNGAPPSSVASLPQGSFSPADRVAAAAAAGGNADIKIWVHDVNVQAGKTYRYKIKYVISNPVAGTINVCQNPDDAQKAWIESQFSQWSDPINVESDTNFYAIDNKHGIRFDIFKWKNGVWQMQTVQANPGDRVGTLDNTTAHTDFDTGWTLVDVREDPTGNTENKVLVLVSDNGTVKEKEIALDRQNAEYRKLLGEVMADRQKTASAGGAPPTVR